MLYLVHIYEFDEHFENCDGPKNAFNILMNNIIKCS